MFLVKGETKIPMEVNLRKADTFLQRLRGLMFRREPLKEEGLWIVPCNSIHMFFMHFAIDAVFLDKQNRIIKLVEQVQPRSIISPVHSAYSVLELPAGTIERFQMETGNQILLD